MLSLLSISLLASCKKDVAKSSTSVGNAKSTARMVPDDTSAMLATQVNGFAYYADAYLVNSAASVPQGLSTTLSSDEANNLLENTYNFIYSQRDDELLSDTSVAISVVINKNSSGALAIGAIAAAYNSSFSTLKSAFLAFAPTDKVLSFVDVEITNEGNSTATLSFTAHFGWNKEITPTELTGLGGTFFPTVPNGDYWHWTMLGGKYGTTLYNGVKGSPELIAQYVRAYKGYVSPTAAVRFKTPINLKLSETHPGYGTTHALYLLPTRPTSAPNTPAYPGRHGVNPSNCLLWTKLYDFPVDPMEKWVKGDAINYHITQCPVLLDRAEAKTGKAVWSFSIHHLLALTTSPYNAWHHIKITCADQVNSSIITSNLPYKATATTTKPFKQL